MTQRGRREPVVVLLLPFVLVSFAANSLITPVSYTHLTLPTNREV